MGETHSKQGQAPKIKQKIVRLRVVTTGPNG